MKKVLAVTVLSAAAAIATAYVAPSPAVAAEAKVDFEKQIWPIFEARCIDCHGPDYLDKRGRRKKAKAGLRLDSAEAIVKGAKEGEVLIPGKPEESTLYTLAVLPEEDEDIMPPKGDPLTAEQQGLLKAWIAQGADFGGWEKGPDADLDLQKPKQ